MELTYAKSAVELWGWTILEPVTAITDVLLFLTSLYLGWRLIKVIPMGNSNKWWVYFIWFTSMPALLGAFNHAFYDYIYPVPYIAIWITINVFVSFGIFCGEMACLNTYVKPKYYRRWTAFFLIKYLIIVVMLVVFKEATVYKINFGIGFAFIIATLFIKKEEIEIGRWKILVGIFIVIVGGIIQSAKWAIDPLWFNGNDIAHLMICISIILISRGVRNSVLSVNKHKLST